MFTLKNAYFNKLTREFYLNIKLNKHFSNGSKSLMRNYNFDKAKKLSLLNSNLFDKRTFSDNNNNNLLVKDLQQQQIKYYTTFTDKTANSATHTTTSSSSATPDLVIERNYGGIVELKLNRSQGKNSLSKKLLSEVVFLV
jgi:hypothetical protein